MARRLARLTLDNLGDLPLGCQSCVFWELDPVRRQRAADAGECGAEKEAWVSATLLEWGSCGRVAYVDGDPAGYVLYAPAVVPARRRRVPDRPGQRGRRAARDRRGPPRVRRPGAGPGADADRRQGPHQARRHPGPGGDRRHPGAGSRRGRLRRLRAAGRLPAAGGLQDPPAAPALPADAPRAALGASPGATRSRPRWSGCSAPCVRCGTRPPTPRTGWAAPPTGSSRRRPETGQVRSADRSSPSRSTPVGASSSGSR